MGQTKNLSSSHSQSHIPEEEFKSVVNSNNAAAQKSQLSLARAKESIRKLPMFETYDDGLEEYDFEWPSKSNIKQITSVKQMRLKEIRYQQDALGMLSAIKFVCHDMSSSFFSGSLDKKSQSNVLYANCFIDNKDGHYRCNNVAARIEFNKMISNVYFNEDKSGIQRIGTKRGNGPLSHVTLEPGEEIIGCYGNYSDINDRSVISGLGFIVWTPNGY